MQPHDPTNHGHHRRERLGRPGASAAVLAALLIAALAAIATGGASRPFAVAAQDQAGPTPEAQVRTVAVNGSGRVQLAPDTASVVTGVDISDRSLAAAQAEATEKMAGIIQAARDAGIAEEDIQTTSYNVNILREYDRDGNLSEITGYQVANQVALTVRDVSTLGALLDAVVAAGANDVYGVGFYVDDPSAAASQARTQAVEDARAKAEELASAAGTRIVGVLTIAETSAPPPAPVEYERAAAEDTSSSGAAEPVPIQAGTSEVAVDVGIVFELAEP